MRFVVFALALMALFSTASAQFLKKPRVDYFDKRFLGWTCEGMDYAKPSGNPLKPDDLSDIVAEDPRCGVFFAVDVSKLQLTCLPALGPNKKDTCKPVKDPNSILYIMRRTDYDGLMPPVDKIGNTAGLAAGMGGIGVSPELMGRVDPTGFWMAGYESGSASDFFASTFSQNPTAVANAMGMGMPGMFPPIRGFPEAEAEDIKQYNYFVQGIITRDMDASEKQKYAGMASLNGQTVKPINPAYFGTDNENWANHGYLEGLIADQEAKKPDSTDSTDSTSDAADTADTPATADTADTPDNTAASTAASDLLSFMNNPLLLVDRDVDDLPLPMNTMGTGMGGTDMNNLATMMAMGDMGNLMLKAYRRGARDELNTHVRRLRRPRSMVNDDTRDMMMMQMQGLAGGNMDMSAMAGMAGMAGMTGGAMYGQPVNSQDTCNKALSSALQSGCMGVEHEDQAQYMQICIYGKQVIAGPMRNPDIDMTELMNYGMCAKLTQNDAMKKILTPQGDGSVMSGIQSMMGGMGDNEDMAAMMAMQGAGAGGSMASNMQNMMMGLTDADDLATMMAMQGGAASSNGMNMALLLDDMEGGMMMPGLLDMSQAEPMNDAATTTTSRLLRRPRGMTPTINLAGLPFRLEDSEDYVTAARVKQYIASLPEGSQISLPPMMDTDLFDDLGEGMMGGFGGMGLGGLSGMVTPTSTSTSTSSSSSSSGTPKCGSYKGMLPADGIDEGLMMLPMYLPLVRDIAACLGQWAISDGVNSDTVAIYAAMRGYTAPSTTTDSTATTTDSSTDSSTDATVATDSTARRLRRPRYNRYVPQRTYGYRKYAW